MKHVAVTEADSAVLKRACCRTMHIQVTGLVLLGTCHTTPQIEGYTVSSFAEPYADKTHILQAAVSRCNTLPQLGSERLCSSPSAQRRYTGQRA